jgi:hypothetical protein
MDMKEGFFFKRKNQGQHHYCLSIGGASAELPAVARTMPRAAKRIHCFTERREPHEGQSSQGYSQIITVWFCLCAYVS